MCVDRLTRSERLAPVIRRHWMFAGCMTAAVLLRIVVMVAYEPALLLQSDAYVYIERAIEVEPAHFRPIFYSLFLWPFVHLHSLQPVVLLQHLLGLGMAAAIYVWLQRRDVPRGLAVAAAAPVALDGYQINIEHHLLAETLFQVLTLGALLLVMRRGRPPAWETGVVGALLGLAAITRFVGAFALMPLLIYLVWRGAGWRRMVAGLAGFSLVLIAYASWFGSVHGSFGITDRQGFMLYGRVAPWVVCDELDIPSYARDLCDRRPPGDRPGGNHYVFSSSPARDISPPEGLTQEEVAGEFAMAAIRQQPLGYLRVVLGDLWHYMLPGRQTGPKDGQLRLWRFPVSFDPEAGHAYLVRVNEGSPPPAVDERRFMIRTIPAKALRSYQSYVYTYGPLVLLMLVVSALALLWRNRCRHVKPEIFLLLSSSVILLVVPLASVQFDYRFLLLVLPMLPVAAALSVSCVMQEASRSDRSQDARGTELPSEGQAGREAIR